MNEKRARQLISIPYSYGPILYWMSRDQRASDNWALIYARQLAKEHKTSLIVAFTLSPGFLGATLRQYDFMLAGLEEIEKSLSKKNIPFHVLFGEPHEQILEFIKSKKIGIVVSDFDPLKIKKEWKRKVLSQINVPFYEVDAHNIVPCWIASQKQEYGAYTIRPKIHKLLNHFLDDYPELEAQESETALRINNFEELRQKLEVDNSVAPVTWIAPGEHAAKKALAAFIEKKLEKYAKDKNDPTKDALSNLSPYLHFGQLSAQRVAMNILKTGSKACETFLEELVVRRELADNFCHYNQNYDTPDGFPTWARQTYEDHKHDMREYTYTLRQFEEAKTHDDLWNACQKEMMKTGKMHGYMRMYWAKKIFEWVHSQKEAMRIAIYLNDRYELDGRDSSGYAGIAWSIGGVHDRPWFERNVFGKIRYMSYNGCKTKFDIKKYIEKINNL